MLLCIFKTNFLQKMNRGLIQFLKITHCSHESCRVCNTKSHLCFLNSWLIEASIEFVCDGLTFSCVVYTGCVTMLYFAFIPRTRVKAFEQELWCDFINIFNTNFNKCTNCRSKPLDFDGTTTRPRVPSDSNIGSDA